MLGTWIVVLSVLILCLILGFLPYILGIIIFLIVIYIIIKKIGIEDQETKKKIIIGFVYISIALAPLWYNYASAKPNDNYVRMKEIDDNQSLIGLSKEQVVELLGDPYGNKDADSYCYDAGKITNYMIGGTNDFYYLKVVFDENGIVKSTSIELEV